MKVPKKLRIMGRDYPVLRCELIFPNEPETHGLIRHDTEQIIIRKVTYDFTEANEAETLLHECIHACDRHMLIGLSEEQTTRLASCLLALIRDNKLDFRPESVK